MGNFDVKMEDASLQWNYIGPNPLDILLGPPMGTQWPAANETDMDTNDLYPPGTFLGTSNMHVLTAESLVNSPRDLELLFDQKITAFGADFKAFNDFDTGQEMDKTALRIDGNTPVPLPPANPIDWQFTFFGFVSDDEFSLVKFLAQSNDAFGIDNITFQREIASPESDPPPDGVDPVGHDGDPDPGPSGPFHEPGDPGPAIWDGILAVSPYGVAGDGTSWDDANNWTNDFTPDLGPSTVSPYDDVIFPLGPPSGAGPTAGTVDLDGLGPEKNRSVGWIVFQDDYTLADVPMDSTLTVTKGDIYVDTGKTVTIDSVLTSNLDLSDPISSGIGISKLYDGKLVTNGNIVDSLSVRGGRMEANGEIQGSFVRVAENGILVANNLVANNGVDLMTIEIADNGIFEVNGLVKGNISIKGNGTLSGIGSVGEDMASPFNGDATIFSTGTLRPSFNANTGDQMTIDSVSWVDGDRESSTYLQPGSYGTLSFESVEEVVFGPIPSFGTYSITIPVTSQGSPATLVAAGTFVRLQRHGGSCHSQLDGVGREFLPSC